MLVRFWAGFISVFPFMYMNIKGLPFNKVTIIGGWQNVGRDIQLATNKVIRKNDSK